MGLTRYALLSATNPRQPTSSRRTRSALILTSIVAWSFVAATLWPSTLNYRSCSPTTTTACRASPIRITTPVKSCERCCSPCDQRPRMQRLMKSSPSSCRNWNRTTATLMPRSFRTTSHHSPSSCAVMCSCPRLRLSLSRTTPVTCAPVASPLPRKPSTCQGCAPSSIAPAVSDGYTTTSIRLRTSPCRRHATENLT